MYNSVNARLRIIVKISCQNMAIGISNDHFSLKIETVNLFYLKCNARDKFFPIGLHAESFSAMGRFLMLRGKIELAKKFKISRG